MATTARKPVPAARNLRKPVPARKLPSYAVLVASKIEGGAHRASAAQQAQIEVWAARHNVSYNHNAAMNQTKAIDADHADALRTEARNAKVAAMSAAEDFELETRSQEKAFDDLCTHYSEGNALLILAQAAELGLKVRGLRDVAGFTTWNERGRAVVKGQHQCIFIWGRKVERDDTAKGAEGDAGTSAPATESERKARAFYPIVGLFHVSQTEDKAKADARRAAERAGE